MKTIESNNFHNPRGPSIHVIFHLVEKGIRRIDLYPIENEGITISIEGEKENAHASSLIIDWVDTYCKKKQPKIILPLIMDGMPPYTKQVLSILRDIPFGLSLSYKELAEITENSKGARAVGNACSRNPFPFVIPCHRVLGSKNSVGGFSAGLEIKERLLRFEKIYFQSYTKYQK